MRAVLGGQQWAGSRADCLDGPCSVSPVCPEAPASPSGAQPQWPLDASFALRSSPTVGRDALPEPAAVSQTAPAGGGGSSLRIPARGPTRAAAGVPHFRRVL